MPVCYQRQCRLQRAPDPFGPLDRTLDSGERDNAVPCAPVPLVVGLGAGELLPEAIESTFTATPAHSGAVRPT
jgi:hypothetical protein